jgi:AcrR family transcriptional regulator
MGSEPVTGLRLPRAQRRQQILAAAAEAFAEAGFRGTSLADVAARVGVSQPGLLHHYPTKEALILAVLAERDEDDRRHLDEVFRGTAMNLVDWLTTLCTINSERPELVRLFAVAAAESLHPAHPAHTYFQERYERLRGSVAARVVIEQDEGRLPGALDPMATATELLALMDGLQMQWLVQPGIDMCAIYRNALERLATHAGTSAA